MVAEGCIRCHSNSTPRRATRHKGGAVICQNTANCRRRQRRRSTIQRRTYALTR